MSDPYRGTVESDIDAVKRREAEEERLAKMTPLDRAKLRRDQLHVAYGGAGLAQTPSDPVKRARALEQYRKLGNDYLDACAEVERLLSARNGGR